MNHARAFTWIPPDSPADQSIQMHPAGRDWDAIRVPVYLADATIEALDDCGAVLGDTWGGCVYWLVPVGTADTWTVPYTRACGETQYVAVPSTGHREPPGLHWLIPPTADRCLTDPVLLRDAVESAIALELGPRETAS